MNRRKTGLLAWSEGSDTVTVTRQGQALVIEHGVAGAKAGALVLPHSRGLLLGLREACDQALRGLGPEKIKIIRVVPQDGLRAVKVGPDYAPGWQVCVQISETRPVGTQVWGRLRGRKVQVVWTRMEDLVWLRVHGEAPPVVEAGDEIEVTHG